MKPIKHNNNWIIEYSEGVYVKDFDNIGHISLTSSKDKASQGDSEYWANMVISNLNKVNNLPISIPPQDITDELIPNEKDTMKIVMVFAALAGFMGWVFVKLRELIFAN